MSKEVKDIEDYSEFSPMMRHYLKKKEQYGDAILLYRLGDFYEMFGADAEVVSEFLGIVLTKKKCGNNQTVKMCGVPYHAAEGYISKLVANGLKVAICEQLTEPQKGVKIVERDVLRVITPGTVTEDSMLESTKNNYILCIAKRGEAVGVSYCDITTGEFVVNLDLNGKLSDAISDVVVRVSPSEVIGNKEAEALYKSQLLFKSGSLTDFSVYYEYAFEGCKADENLKSQFGVNYKKVYELEDSNAAIIAAGALMEYLKDTQKRSLNNINFIKVVSNKDFMVIDANTRRNLELCETMMDRRLKGSLLSHLNKTKTPMGSRLIKKYIDEPLINSEKINERLSAVSELKSQIILRETILDALCDVKDIERICGKIAYGNVMPKELVTLKHSLFSLPKLKQALSLTKSKLLSSAFENLSEFKDISNFLDEILKSEPPTLTKDGGYIKDGYNKELDDYRHAGDNSKGWILELEKKEREETGIKTLKIGFNRVFGYYIEVPRSVGGEVPLRWQRRQTVANNERFISAELKKIEDLVLSSEEKSIKLEEEIYKNLKEFLLDKIDGFQKISKIIANIDVLASFATCAVKYNYVKPLVSDKISKIKIEDGRHPIVEDFLKGESFISNDTLLDEADNRTMVITGPNMAGKSTYMRQVALITLMAHIGCFVPAKSAEIAITDRIFTRVGASDDLASGQSTFMVEMSEVANILKNATDKSLIILDEIGRGTSTFDGLSIAWSVMEYLAKHLKAKTLFATHYHELTGLEGILEGVKNYKIMVKETDKTVVFLRKIARGGANKSFGIEVAALSGIPKEVTDRAKEISKNLEKVNTNLDLSLYGSEMFSEEKSCAETLNKMGNEIVSILKDININKISPMTAFELLNELCEKVRKE